MQQGCLCVMKRALIPRTCLAYRPLTIIPRALYTTIRHANTIHTNPSTHTHMTKPRDHVRMHQRHTSTTQCQSGDALVNHTKTRGIEILRNPMLNKGQAFSLRERQLLGLIGLLPASILTQDEQMIRVMQNFEHFKTDLDKYIYLIALQDRNEKLFYRCLTDNVEQMMPIVYTPTVGLACQNYGLTYRRPRGVFLSINDAGHLYEMLYNWPENTVKAVVVTDGERILGLGDLGAYGMGIPVGKLSLYTALSRVDPAHCLPVHLDVGTDNEELLTDPLYLGLRQKRVRGDKYDAFIDEFMEAVVTKYGRNTLIQFEDFANANAHRLLKKYRDIYCMFNDDIQGTAAVAAAGVLAAMRITGKHIADNTFLFQGAGTANLGIANMLVLAMKEAGTDTDTAISRIYMFDAGGLLTKNRSDLTDDQTLYAKDVTECKDLHTIVKLIKPSVLIGASACPGAFSEAVIKEMSSINKRPVIFALSNPTSLAECTAEQAYTWSDGRCIYASGSPFNPVEHNGITHYPGQCNNAYIFPGVALAVLNYKIYHIPDSIFLKSAAVLSSLATDHDLAQGRLFPPLSEIHDVSLRIATDIANFAYENKMAARYPEPSDKEKFLRSNLYSTEYESFVPPTWDWPTNI